MWWMVIASFLFPGFGQGLVHRRVRAGAWAIVALGAVFGIVWSVWLAPVALIVHLASAIDASWCLRRDARPGGLDRMFGAVVIVIGAVGFGLWRLSIESFRIPSSSMYPTIEIGDRLFADKLTVRWRPIERGELVVHRYPCDPRVVYVKRVVAVGGDTVEIRCDVLYVNGKAVPRTKVADVWEYEDYDAEVHDWVRRQVSRWHEELDGHAYDVFEGVGKTGLRDFPDLGRPFAPGCTDQAMFREPAQTHEVKGEIVDTRPVKPYELPAKPVAPPPDPARCELQRHYVVPKGALFGLGDNRYNANDSRYWGAFREDDVVGRVIGVWLNDGQHGTFGRFGALR